MDTSYRTGADRFAARFGNVKPAKDLSEAARKIGERPGEMIVTKAQHEKLLKAYEPRRSANPVNVTIQIREPEPEPPAPRIELAEKEFTLKPAELKDLRAEVEPESLPPEDLEDIGALPAVEESEVEAVETRPHEPCFYWQDRRGWWWGDPDGERSGPFPSYSLCLADREGR